MASFALGVYEVTFGEYDRFAQASGRDRSNDRGWGRAGRPVLGPDELEPDLKLRYAGRRLPPPTTGRSRASITKLRVIARPAYALPVRSGAVISMPFLCCGTSN